MCSGVITSSEQLHEIVFFCVTHFKSESHGIILSLVFQTHRESLTSWERTATTYLERTNSLLLAPGGVFLRKEWKELETQLKITKMLSTVLYKLKISTQISIRYGY